MSGINKGGNPDNKISSIEYELMKALVEEKVNENQNLKTTIAAIRNKEIDLRDQVALTIFQNLTKYISIRLDSEQVETFTRTSYEAADIFMRTRDSRLEFTFKVNNDENTKQ